MFIFCCLFMLESVATGGVHRVEFFNETQEPLSTKRRGVNGWKKISLEWTVPLQSWQRRLIQMKSPQSKTERSIINGCHQWAECPSFGARTPGGRNAHSVLNNECQSHHFHQTPDSCARRQDTHPQNESCKPVRGRKPRHCTGNKPLPQRMIDGLPCDCQDEC